MNIKQASYDGLSRRNPLFIYIVFIIITCGLKKINYCSFCILITAKPFTFIVPKIDIKTIESDKESLTLSDSIFMLEHIIPGVAFSTFNEEDLYGNMNGHDIVFEKLDTVNESKWTLNGFKILRTEVIDEMVSFIYIDGVLGDRKAPFSKRNIQETNR